MSYFEAGGESVIDKTARLRREKEERNWRAMVENTGRRNKQAIKDLRHSDADQRRLIRESGGKKAAKPAAKPKGDQQIDAPKVQHSKEVQSAKEKADAWLKGSQNDYSSIYKSDPNQNLSGDFDIGGEGSQTSFDPTKYMQDFTGSGQQQKQQNAQTHEVESNSMSAQDIVNQDKQDAERWDRASVPSFKS